MFKYQLLGYVFVLAFSFCTAQAGEIAVPCTSGTSNVSKSKTKFFRPCDETTNQTVTLLGNHINTYIDKAYTKGVSLDFSSQDLENPLGKKIRGPICDLFSNPFNKCQNEGDTNDQNAANHIGKVCGQYTKVKIEKTGGFWTGGPTIKITVEPQLVNSSREVSFKNGMWIQIIAYNYDQVVKEISNTNHKLNVSPKCQAAAADLSQQTEQASGIANSLEKNILDAGQLKNASEVWKCSADWGSQTDRGKLKQAAQQLCAARNAIEASFLQLAACEIFSRSADKLTSILGDSNEFNNLRNKIAAPIEEACGNKDSVPEAQTCVDNQFPIQMRQYFKEKMRGLEISTCTPWIAGFLIRRRKRKQNKRKLLSRSLNKLFSVIILIAAAKLIGGCAVGIVEDKLGCPEYGKTFSDDELNAMIGYNSECCTDKVFKEACCNASVPTFNAAALVNNADGTCSPIPADDPISSTLNSAAEANSIAASSIGVAQTLVSDANSAEIGTYDPTGIQKGAEAGDLGSTFKPTKPSDKAASTVGGTKHSSRSSAGGGSTGTSSSSGSLFGSTSTTSAVSPTGGASPTPVMIGAEGSLYESKGAAAAQAGGGPAYKYNSGDTAVAAGAAQSGELALGSKSPDGPFAPGVSDPLDYFSRIGLEESLFKKVERRYNEKAMSWARKDLGIK